MMDVNSKEADDWSKTLLVAEIIHEQIGGVDWPKATTVAADVILRVFGPRDDGEKSEGQAHKVMTPEEYAAMPIKGWHEVCRDVDGSGGVGIRFLG